MQSASNQPSHGFCHTGQSSAEILCSVATILVPYFCCPCAPQEDWTVLGSETQSRATFYHGFGQPRGVAGDNVLQEDLQLASNQPSHGFCHSGQSSAEILGLGATLPYFCCQCAPQEDWTVLGSETQSRATFYHGFGQSRGAANDHVSQEDLQLASNQPSHGFWHSGQSSAEIWGLGATVRYFCDRWAGQLAALAAD